MLNLLKKVYLGLVLILLCCLLSACGPSPEDLAATSAAETKAAATNTPLPTSTLSPTSTPIPTSTPALPFLDPASPLQIEMFSFIPSGFISASYCDMALIKEDPDLMMALESFTTNLAYGDSIEDIDAAAAFVVPATMKLDSSGVGISWTSIYRGNLDQDAIMNQVMSSGASTRDYRGVEITTKELESGFTVASAFLDETTWLENNEGGVMAVIDMVRDQTVPPLADLGATLPRVFFVMMYGFCQYDYCDTSVIISLAKRPDGTISAIQLYQFENAEMAADALPAIMVQQEAGEMIQNIGSLTISGDYVTQEGRYIMIEGTLPVEDIHRLFE